jgi:hypothetical protein
MHALPTASYFDGCSRCTDYMIMLIAKYTVATCVHVPPRGNGLAQKGCLATIGAEMHVLACPPRTGGSRGV